MYACFPHRLLAPIDSEGRLCGLDAAVIDRPKGYYLPSASFVCIDECPQATDASIFYCSGDDANYKRLGVSFPQHIQKGLKLINQSYHTSTYLNTYIHRSISASSVGPMISNNTCMFQIKTKTGMCVYSPTKSSSSSSHDLPPSPAFLGQSWATVSHSMPTIKMNSWRLMAKLLMAPWEGTPLITLLN